jgi:general nucleoside transport system permease protein
LGCSWPGGAWRRLPVSDPRSGPNDEDPPVRVDPRPEALEKEAAPAEEPLPATTLASEITGPGRVRWWQAAVLPLLALLTALVLGAIVIVFTNEAALQEWKGFFRDPVEALSVSWQVTRDAYYALFAGALGSPSQIVRAFGSGEIEQIRGALFPLSETLVLATPLILVGLSVAIGFRAGLFNIGAEGQMNAGAIVAAAVGISFAGLPGPVHLAFVVIAGLLGGMVWGFIPGILKAKTGAHEVITTIMLNFIAVSLTLYVLSIAPYKQQAEPISKPVQVAFPHLFGTNLRVHVGLFMALAVAALIAWILNRTTIGFEFRAVGANPAAARANGMNPTRTIIVVMTVAGGLAGLAAANQLGGVTPSLIPGFASGLGFDAIALALLGRGTPLGVVLSAFLFGILRAGGRNMQAVTQTPIDIIVVIQGLVIAFVAAPALVRAIFRIKARRLAGPTTFAKGWGG